MSKGLLFLLSQIFLSHKIKDGGYNNTNINKQLSLAQNKSALQASRLMDANTVEYSVATQLSVPTLLAKTYLDSKGSTIVDTNMTAMSVLETEVF